MEKTFLKIRNWIKDNKKEAIILGLVLILGAVLRLYRIGDYMTFLGDEGRDAIIVRRLLVYGDPILIGPGTSIGNMYLGPLYYYMMAPALFLSRFSPIGPAVMIALLGVITVFFVWFITKDWFGKSAALISSFFYAIAPTVIIYSRSSWNPNIMPFFALLAIWGTWKFWQEKKWKWIPVIGISLAFTLQSHYLGLLLIPVVGLFYLLTFIRLKGEKSFIKTSLLSLAIFLFLMSPLVIFDARHGWNNFGAIKKFFTERQTTVSALPWKALPKIAPLSEKIVTRVVAGKDEAAGKFTLWGLVALSLYVFANREKLGKKEKNSFAILLIWLGFALLGLGLYKQEIYDHYYGFFFAAPFIFLGGLITTSLKMDEKKILLGPIVAGGLLLTLANFSNNPFEDTPNRQMARSRTIAEKIIAESKGEKFNLAVLAERNYEDGYQYFLEVEGAPVIDIDPQKAQETTAEQLFVVCELPKEKCEPTTNPKAQVANFGWSKIETEWEIEGLTLYKLIHSK
jgi:4-amino-4-deoxy-L-arabinose transferase-like glycosyltransferase